MVYTMKLFSADSIKRWWEDSGFQKYLKNTTWMMGSRILSMAISFLATLFIARNLGPTNFGQLSYAVSFIGLFSFIASLGVDSVLYRDLIRKPEERLSMFGTAFSIKFAAGLVAGIVSVIFALFLTEDDVSKTLIFILAGTFILNPFQIISFEFQSRAESKYPSVITFIVTLILNALKIGVISSGKGVIYLALILLLEPILYAILYIYIYERKSGESTSSWSFDRRYACSLLKDSSPFIVLNAFAMIYARVDQVFIKHMIDATAVGLYDSAVRLAEVWSFVPGIIVASVYPAIVHAKEISEDLYERRLAKLAFLLLILAIIIALPISLLASFIIKIVYGNAFIGAIPVLKIYVWANIGTFMGIFVTQYLMTENLRKILSFIAFFPMTTNVVLNILWIPEYGIQGAAYATLISYSLTPLSLLFFKVTRNKLVRLYRSFQL